MVPQLQVMSKKDKIHSVQKHAQRTCMKGGSKGSRTTAPGFPQPLTAGAAEKDENRNLVETQMPLMACTAEFRAAGDREFEKNTFAMKSLDMIAPPAAYKPDLLLMLVSSAISPG